MFDDDEDESSENYLKEDLEKFESYIKGNNTVFIDSDRLEAIVDHYLINGNFTKALLATDMAITHFTYNGLFSLRKAQSLTGLGKLNDAIDVLDNIQSFGVPVFEFHLTKASRTWSKAYELSLQVFVSSAPGERA